MMLAPLAPPQPQTTQPLFTQEQLRESKAAARKAPQIYGHVQATSSSNEELHLQVKRPAFLKEEEERFEEMKREDFERWKRGEGHEDEEEAESEELRKSEGGDRRRRDRHQQDEEEIMWRWHMSQEVQKLTDLCHHQQKENDRLQQELYERRLEDEVRRRSEEERMKRLAEEKPSKTSSTFNTPEEGKMPDPTMPEARGRTPWSTYPTRYGMKGSRSRSKDTRKGRSPTYGKGAREDSKGPPWTRPTVGGAKPSPEVQQMEVMTLLVESMKALQKQISEGHDAQGTIKGVEVVRQLGELPTLGPMHGTTSQLQLGDWLLLMQPVVADLTATSDPWWDQTLKEVEKWYQAHQNMAPLDRVRHEPIAPASLNVAKWAKLERRMATLMLKAIPEAQRDEVVAMKRLSVFAILAHLHTSYCPGGVSEKQMLLRNLEEPSEPTGLHDTVVGLRRWLRWRARAQEIGATEPDPSILVKGLNKLTKKTLEGNEALRFRVSLARNALQVDTNPTAQSVTQFATHLIAEVDQLSLVEKRSAAMNTSSATTKVKKVEKEKEKKEVEGKVKNVGNASNDAQPLCKFFLTDNGCRKGKNCKWSHDQRDECKRCYNCGGKNHMAPACPNRDPPSQGSSTSPPKVKKEKEEEKGGRCEAQEAEKSAGGGTMTEDDKMDELLSEANKMLRMMKDKESSEAKMNKLHQQLDEIKKSMKTLKLTRVKEAQRTMRPAFWTQAQPILSVH